MTFVKRHFRLHSKAVLASLLTGVVLLLGAMSASPALHEMIHHDAGEPGHECAVTLFAHGHVDSSTVEVPVVVPAASIEVTPRIVFSVFAPAIENLPSGRAPPLFPSVS